MGKIKKDIMQGIEEAKVVFNNEKQLLCSNNFSLEMRDKLIKSCECSAALYGSEPWTAGKNEERAINTFETWYWRRMLKIKWTDRITNDVFSKGERRMNTFKYFKK